MQLELLVEFYNVLTLLSAPEAVIKIPILSRIELTAYALLEICEVSTSLLGRIGQLLRNKKCIGQLCTKKVAINPACG